MKILNEVTALKAGKKDGTLGQSSPEKLRLLSEEEAAEFVQSHLDRVSRSFAFCIRQLPNPLRLWVGVSYLVCRVADTVEDSEYGSPQQQKDAFEWLFRCLKGTIRPVYPHTLWPKGISRGEDLLLRDAENVFLIFFNLKTEVRLAIAPLVESMALGMRHFVLRTPEKGMRLFDLKEVNQYCFFVAGLVGEMLVNLLSQVEPAFLSGAKELVRAHHFGLFLQKVNLLKDQLKDQKLGRFLVPSRDLVKSGAADNANEAIRFLIGLPLGQKEFRRFCGWSFFMGLESLRKEEKLTRLETEQVLLEVEEVLDDNLGLMELFKKKAISLGWSSDAQKTNFEEREAPPWLSSFYQGKLELKDLNSLGVC